MIAGSFGQIAPQTVHDHEFGPASRGDRLLWRDVGSLIGLMFTVARSFAKPLVLLRSQPTPATPDIRPGAPSYAVDATPMQLYMHGSGIRTKRPRDG
jgi:hypothetical protein